MTHLSLSPVTIPAGTDQSFTRSTLTDLEAALVVAEMCHDAQYGRGNRVSEELRSMNERVRRLALLTPADLTPAEQADEDQARAIIAAASLPVVKPVARGYEGLEYPTLRQQLKDTFRKVRQG